MEESKIELTKVAAAMKSDPKLKLSIEGHTDSVGSGPSNQKLSEERALSCQKELVVQGVDSTKISYEGFGEDQPIAENNTAEGRQKNRRVVFKTSLE